MAQWIPASSYAGFIFRARASLTIVSSWGLRSDRSSRLISVRCIEAMAPSSSCER